MRNKNTCNNDNCLRILTNRLFQSRDFCQTLNLCKLKSIRRKIFNRLFFPESYLAIDFPVPFPGIFSPNFPHAFSTFAYFFPSSLSPTQFYSGAILCDWIKIVGWIKPKRIEISSALSNCVRSLSVTFHCTFYGESPIDGRSCSLLPSFAYRFFKCKTFGVDRLSLF